MDVYALFEEESPQYGTSRLIGIYDSVELAEKNKSNRRCFVRVVVLNEKPSSDAKYISFKHASEL